MKDKIDIRKVYFESVKSFLRDQEAEVMERVIAETVDSGSSVIIPMARNNCASYLDADIGLNSKTDSHRKTAKRNTNHNISP